MTRSKYCSKCGLEYRKWSFAVENPACEECEPEKYKKIYKDNITQIKNMARRLQPYLAALASLPILTSVP